ALAVLGGLGAVGVLLALATDSGSEFRRLLRTGGRLLFPLRLPRVQHLDAVRQGGERLDVLVGQVGAVAVEGVEVLHRLGVERGERLVVQAGEVLGNLERGPLVLLLGLVLVLRRQAGDAAQAGDRACHHGLLVVGTTFVTTEALHAMPVPRPYAPSGS